MGRKKRGLHRVEFVIFDYPRGVEKGDRGMPVRRCLAALLRALLEERLRPSAEKAR